MILNFKEIFALPLTRQNFDLNDANFIDMFRKIQNFSKIIKLDEFTW